MIFQFQDSTDQKCGGHKNYILLLSNCMSRPLTTYTLDADEWSP